MVPNQEIKVFLSFNWGLVYSKKERKNKKIEKKLKEIYISIDMARGLGILFVLLCFAPTTLRANELESDEYWVEHENEFDSYWKERAKVAKEVNQEAYFPDPYAVSGNLTETVTE